MDARINKLRQAAQKGIPRNWAGRRLRHVIDMELKHVEVKFSEKQLCRVGRMIQHAVGFVANHLDSEVAEDVSEAIDSVLDEVGCKE